MSKKECFEEGYTHETHHVFEEWLDSTDGDIFFIVYFIRRWRWHVAELVFGAIFCDDEESSFDESVRIVVVFLRDDFFEEDVFAFFLIVKDLEGVESVDLDDTIEDDLKGLA